MLVIIALLVAAILITLLSAWPVIGWILAGFVALATVILILESIPAWVLVVGALTVAVIAGVAAVFFPGDSKERWE